ncbi:MAG TPA: Gfo/Idh/MocA family oxidoreductase [Planctomycetota bacterium]|jgi:UDP-2-acetamido-3-amino-2,3-dideoxy-glucuronate N-acetyltransferase|nr:Gfo/Idh/MocA family oxidoreductase [Planctomycetota bacterium]
MKVVLLGVGRWGANHLRILHSLPVDLRVVDVNPARLEQARSLGIPEERLSTDARRFTSAADAVVVATPAQTHAEIGRALLEEGKDVFVEKPLALRSEEAMALVEIAERRGRILQVGHVFRYDPASLWLREEIRRGSFGRIKILRGIFSGFKRPRQDTGVAFADAIHFADLFGFLLGGRTPARVTALVRDFLGRRMDDECLLSLEYEPASSRVASREGPGVDGGGTWGVIEAGYHLPGKFRQVRVVGDAASAVCDFNVAQYKIQVFENRHVPEGPGFRAVEGAVRQLEFPPEEPLLVELRAFVDSLTTRRPPLADGRAGYQAVRVVEAALESARTRRPVELAS